VANLAIPCTPSGQAHWTQRTTLSGRDYVLTFDWSQRDGHWWLTIADQDGVSILTRKLVDRVNLFARVLDTRVPGGQLFAYDTQATGPGLDPDFAGLGSRFELIYVEPS
jgi:hypothetical protein